MTYRLVIFDFDGTLADSGDWFISVMNPVAERFSVRQVTEAEVEALRGRSSREVVAHMGVPAWKMPFIARHLHDLMAQNISRITLFPGVEAMLRGLKDKGVQVALVSSNSEANVRAVLGPERADLVDHYGCGAGIFGKASRFRQVIRRAGVDPAQVISIGDETRDIEAAVKAGVASGAVAWGYARPELLAEHHPTLMFHEMGDILGAVAGGARATQRQA